MNAPDKTSQGQAVRDLVDDREWALRQDLACAYRLVAHYGWDDLIFTHLSVRVPGEGDHFLINPLGLLFEEITASSLVKVDQDAKVILPSPYQINPAGFIIHSALHMGRADAHAVLHVHTVATTAVASQQGGLLPLTQNAMTQWGDIAVHPYEGLALEEGERERLVADLGDKAILMLPNHGVITIGKTVGEAFLRLFFIQRACEMQLAAQSSGAELIMQDAAMGEKVHAQARGAFPLGAYLSWEALKRKMDRQSPGYRD